MSKYSQDMNKAEQILYSHLKRIGTPENEWNNIKNEFLNGFQDGWMSASPQYSTIPQQIGELIPHLSLDIKQNANKIGKSVGAMAGTLRQHPLFPMQHPEFVPTYQKFFQILKSKLPEFIDLMREIIQEWRLYFEKQERVGTPRPSEIKFLREFL
ncbi:hypothetical protein HYX04_05955 [Candidatus Woesearchaeota archaeon]|nr:hypothetical protein [Candidatus Woesearchaeota archaeon]